LNAVLNSTRNELLWLLLLKSSHGSRDGSRAFVMNVLQVFTQNGRRWEAFTAEPTLGKVLGNDFLTTR
jgi:hypothetical protein